MSDNAPRIRTSRLAPTRREQMGSGGKIALSLVAVLVAIAVVFAAVFGWFVTRLSSSYERNAQVITDAFPQSRPAQSEEAKGQTIMLIGTDTRSSITPGSGTLDGPQDGRSDTLMLLHIPEDKSEVFLVSVMRDLWVDIPDHGEAKINAALAYGGVPLAVETVESLLGAHIDEVAVVDFEGFKDLTDALGGVTVLNSVPFEAGGFEFPVGDVTLNGDEALAYVRARKPFADGDYQRVRNQQAYIKAVAQQLISSGTLANPTQLIAVVDAISPYLLVSEGLTTDYIVRTAAGLRNLRPTDLVFLSVPTAGVSTSSDGQSIILPDPEGIAELKAAFENDTLGEFAQSHD